MDKQIKPIDRNQFQIEQDELLYAILDRRFFKPWKQPYGLTPRDKVPKGSLELFITPTCNQKCEYCYLQRHMHALYPMDKNNEENILKNLRALLDWVGENRFNLPNIDLFSGEIWHVPFGLKVLDVLLEYVSQRKIFTHSITIPTNSSFIHSDTQTIEIQNRIDAFARHGVKVVISISVDGKIIEDLERPLNDKSLKRDDEFYDKLFRFAKHNGYGFHPMLAAQGAKYWIENWKWWVSMLRKYDLPIDRVMLLEVRNDDWTDEYVEDYKNFVRYLVDFTFKYHNNDFVETLEDLFLINQVYDTEGGPGALLWGENMPYLPINIGDTKGFYGCTITTHMTVRLGDLAIAPCHRSAYNKYLYGYFEQDSDGKIIGVKANNPQLAVNILMLDNRRAKLGCDSCVFNPVCLSTCIGQSIEANMDPLWNDPGVCKFLYTKYSFLFDLYEEKGLMDWLDKNLTNYHSGYRTWSRLLTVWKALKKERKNAELEQFRQDFYRNC